MAGDLLDTETGIVAIAALGLAVASLLIIIGLSVSLFKAKKRYRQLTNGNDQSNIEGLLIQLQERFDAVRAEQSKQSELMTRILNKIKTMKSKVGVHRYNAFDASGSDLSFTIAMLDEESNGVLLTGIHSREQTYIYAKPVEKGQSAYHLSPEEKETLTRTLQTS
jgi:hypothetical protein